ncbi:MAG: lactoylglutathione lyase [Clostridiales bacterium]|nr:lactoylglutathione lyase [Clostridiales bacterium]
MRFVFDHANLNVTDLDNSIAFYREALGLETARVHEAADGSFKLAFLADAGGATRVELTWLRDKEGRYELGDNESHLCFVVDDFDAARSHHQQMGAICFDNAAMGLYFIEDPDGYWIEIVPRHR